MAKSIYQDKAFQLDDEMIALALKVAKSFKCWRTMLYYYPGNSIDDK